MRFSEAERHRQAVQAGRLSSRVPSELTREDAPASLTGDRPGAACLLRRGSFCEQLGDLPPKGPPDGHPAQPMKVILVDLGDIGQRPTLIVPEAHDSVALDGVGSADRSAELPVVAGASLRVAHDVPCIVDAGHVAGIAAEVRMMTPSERTIGASDRGRIGFWIDAQNGIQGRHWAVVRGCGRAGRAGQGMAQLMRRNPCERRAA